MTGIKKKREEAGLTQEELSQKLGVVRQTVAMWETGKASPSANMLPRIARVLGCTIEELYGDPRPEK